MSSPRERYVKLAPLDVDLETTIARLAAGHFFSPMHYQKVCQVIGKTPAKNGIHPMPSADFLKYLEAMNVLEEPADKYIYHIRDLLVQLQDTCLGIAIPSPLWGEGEGEGNRMRFQPPSPPSSPASGRGGKSDSQRGWLFLH